MTSDRLRARFSEHAMPVKVDTAIAVVDIDFGRAFIPH